MKVVFLASKDKKNNNQQKILDVLNKLKFTIIDGSLAKGEIEKSKQISNLTLEIKKTDGVVVEASSTDFDMGRQITLALQQHKPVLILQQKENTPPLILGSTRLITTKIYHPENEKELQGIFQDFAKTMKKKSLTYRFNLMLSRDINVHLMDKAQAEGVSKADYIRTLLVGDMERDSK